MAKNYKNPLDLVENEYKNLSDEAIDLFGKGQRLDAEKQARYDQVKQEMSKNAKKQWTINDVEDFILNDKEYKGPLHSEVDWDSMFRGFENKQDAATFGEYIKQKLGLDYEIHGDRGPNAARIFFKDVKDQY